jgi:peptidyl-prolyl cis-trans isomerase SurA
MSKNLFILMSFIALQFVCNLTNAQTLMTIGDKDITKDEFLRIYNKNRGIEAESDRSIDDYLQLFINYKLKVIEAENLGYDTLSSFIKEMNGYKFQLSNPYLDNNDLLDFYVKESYERLQEEINASHILCMVNFDAFPQDSTKAYNKAMEYRKRIIAGEPFEEVANSTIDKKTAKNDGGKLGWFTANKMVYPFESACYNLKVGEVSMPVKSQYGYHIIKINGRRKNPGELAVSHITILYPENGTELDKQAARQKIDKAYAELKAGKPWKAVVENYSEHERTRKKGGNLGWIKQGMAPEIFADTLYKLKPGEFSNPFKTEGAFHIVKLDSIKPIAPFDSIKASLTKKVKLSNDFIKLSKEKQTEKIIKEYGFKKYFENIKPLYTLVDSGMYKGRWDYTKARDMKDPVFTIGDTTFNQFDFARFINEKRMYNRGVPLNVSVDTRFNEFVDAKSLEYAIKQLPSKYPELKYLLDEYHDGILLFNLTEEKVWKKAIDDTAGLNNFYNQLSQKYSWGERVRISKYIYSDSTIINTLLKVAKKNAKKGSSGQGLSAQICPNDSIPCVTVTELKYEKGDNAIVDSIAWKTGAYLQTKDKNNFVLFFVDEILPQQIKKLEDSRGLYTADYQNYLEKKWIDELRAKYSVKINSDVLENIKKEKSKNIQ